MDVRLPNGVILANVPEGTTKDAIAAKAIKAGLATAQDLFPPTEGMGGTEKVLAGAVSKLGDWAQGAQQLVPGLISQEEIQAKQALDAPLRNDPWGKAGAIVGAVGAPVAAAMTLPGAATVGGGAAIGATMGLLEPVAEGSVAAGKAIQSGIGGLLGGAGNKAGQVIGKKLVQRAANKAATAAASKVANATKDATTQAGQQLGYVVPPTHANPTMLNQMLEGAAGKLTTGQLAASKNQSITDAVAKRALGIADDQPLSLGAVEAVRKQAGQAYEALKSLPGKFATDAQYADDLALISQRNGILAQEFPELATKNVDEIVASFSKPEFSPAGTVEAIKKLRADARTMFKSDDPAKKAAASAYRSIADAMEGVIERNLANSGDDALLTSFRSARELIAKAHTVEDALNEGTGHVIARKLGSQLAAGKPLSGELKQAAKFAQAYPKATQEVSSSMPGWSPLDLYGGGGLSIASSSPLPMLFPAARAAARHGILSAPYQAAMTAPKYSAGGLEQMLGGLLGSPIARTLGAASGPLVYGR